MKRMLVNVPNEMTCVLLGWSKLAPMNMPELGPESELEEVDMTLGGTPVRTCLPLTINLPSESLMSGVIVILKLLFLSSGTTLRCTT